MHRAFAAVAFIVSLPLFFGAVAHAYAPHQHPESAAIVDLMHTAAAAGEKSFVAVPLFVALFLFAIRAQPAPAPAAVEDIRARSSLFLFARQGRARYRRFS